MTYNPRKNKLQQIMEERRKNQQKINEFNKSPEGQALHKKIRDMHNKQGINPEELPF